MFDAIEDIPTDKLIAELMTRKGYAIRKYHEVPMRYLVWNDHDPNDSFEVDADNADGAAWAALDELGWCVSAEPYDPDEDEDEVA
jgi:hypothetical protein